ncbi:MAG: CBS domain-containing protein [Thermoanaerobaculia bacterium]
MLVKDVMTISPMCCKPSDRLDRVAKLMLEHDCGFIPVCEATKLVGVITDRDITCRAVATGKVPNVVPVSEVMTKTVYTVRQDQDVQAAIELMEAKQIRRLPVLDDEDKVVGIIAPSDLAPTFASTNVADFLLAVSYWKRRTVVSPAAEHTHGNDMDLRLRTSDSSKA